MNLKNLAMWAVIVFLTIGLYNMFKNPQSTINKKDTIIFSDFLTEQDAKETKEADKARLELVINFLLEDVLFFIVAYKIN